LVSFFFFFTNFRLEHFLRFFADIWSLGCVLGELLSGRVLFAGQNSVEQLVEIIQVLGTPTRREINAMNSCYEYFEFPAVQKVSWEQVLKSAATPPAVDLLNKILTYNPGSRISPLEICAHSFFDQLRDENTRLPNGQ
jgi:serine/threonine protein kinase